MQSLTLPLQGFFNAIVYGWTQGDFVEVVGNTSAPDERTALIQNFPIENSVNHQDTSTQNPGKVLTLPWQQAGHSLSGIISTSQVIKEADLESQLTIMMKLRF